MNPRISEEHYAHAPAHAQLTGPDPDDLVHLVVGETQREVRLIRAPCRSNENAAAPSTMDEDEGSRREG